MKFFDVKCEFHGEMEISADSDNRCPTLCPITENRKVCGCKLVRVYKKMSFILKGNGFYSTDNK